MSILDVTEDQIFQTLGKGRDPNFKQIEKVRPVVPKPKKTYTLNTMKSVQTPKTVTAQPQMQSVVEPVKPALSPEVDESMRKLSAELSELNTRVSGIQRMVKWYIMPQFLVVLVLLVALIVKS
jgi:hypothetical protein